MLASITPNIVMFHTMNAKPLVWNLMKMVVDLFYKKCTPMITPFKNWFSLLLSADSAFSVDIYYFAPFISRSRAS
jgi:hypothetical protein